MTDRKFFWLSFFLFEGRTESSFQAPFLVIGFGPVFDFGVLILATFGHEWNYSLFPSAKVKSAYVPTQDWDYGEVKAGAARAGRNKDLRSRRGDYD